MAVQQRAQAALRRAPETTRLSRSLEISLVAPVFNEEPNLRPLYDRVRQVLGDRHGWELILVDDGSSDGSSDVMRSLHACDPRVRIVRFEQNRGQTAALLAGMREARAELVATLDADLQNDPADLLGMMRALDDNDAVVGYRVHRRDHWVRRVSSKLANGVRNKLTGEQIRDTGCALKLFRADALRCVPPFEGMHRFLPTLLRMHGLAVIEWPVSHHPRRFGASKYGIRNRALKALLDLFGVRWMRARMIRFPER